MKAQTSHIEICRSKWHDHLDKCARCIVVGFGTISGRPPNFCELGSVLYDEYAAAITAHRDCEHLEAADAPENP